MREMMRDYLKNNDISIKNGTAVRELYDAVVFMDAIHYHVRSEGRIVKRAVYIALGIELNRHMFCIL